MVTWSRPAAWQRRLCRMRALRQAATLAPCQLKVKQSAPLLGLHSLSIVAHAHVTCTCHVAPIWALPSLLERRLRLTQTKCG